MFSKPYSAGPFLSGLNLWWQNSAFIRFLNPKTPSLFFVVVVVLFNPPLPPSAGSCGLVLRGTFGAEEHHCGCSVSTVTRCCSLSCFVLPLYGRLSAASDDAGERGTQSPRRRRESGQGHVPGPGQALPDPLQQHLRRQSCR